jgi:streptomycin 6-kinase
LAAELPQLPPGWRLKSASLLADGIGGRVWRAELADGGTAALKKTSKAARHERAAGEAFLQWRDGRGAVRLLASTSRLSLLEWAGETTLHRHLLQHGEAEATAIAADVITRLHAPSPAPPPAQLRPLREHFSGLFSAAGGNSPAIYRAYLRETAALAERLLANQRDAKPLHGDIHHDNILLGPRSWLAIDPKGLFGDPAYDVANMFQNPVGYAARNDAGRILRLAETMAAAIGRNVEAVLEYAFAYSGLSTAWWLEDGNEEAAASTLEIGRAIGRVMAQVRP